MNELLPLASTSEAWRTPPTTAAPPGVAMDVAGARETEDAAQRFVALYRELLPSVFGFVRFRVGNVHVAEDLTAQVFERALGRLASVRDPQRIRAWIFAIARTTVADHRRGRRDAVDLDSAAQLEQLVVGSAEGEAVLRDEWRRLVTHLVALDERERELLGLKFVAGLSNREIGRVLGLSESNVAQIAHRAVVKLRRRFEAEEILE